MINSVAKTKLSYNSFPLPIGESFYEVKLAIGYHLYDTEDRPKSSSSLSFSAISVAWVNRCRRNIKIFDAAEILGRKSTLYNQILSASLPKYLNCIALKCCVIFFFFLPLQVVKILPRLNYSSTVSFEASQAEFGKPSTVQPACITRHRIKRSPCI